MSRKPIDYTIVQLQSKAGVALLIASRGGSSFN
jgi:hypothetical protein